MVITTSSPFAHTNMSVHVSEGESGGVCYGIISTVYAAKLHIARHYSERHEQVSLI